MKLVAKSLLASAVLAACTIAAPTMAADVSANVGFNSEYYYRGILQKASSANGGFDVEEGGFSAGIWGADVGDGLEIDLYAAYNFEVSDDLSFSVGFTDYEYTGEFDTVYREINLGAAFGPVSLGAHKGVHESPYSGDDQDYTFVEAAFELNGFYAKLGFYPEFDSTHAEDYAPEDGKYFEAGYGTTVSDIDFGVALIVNSKELSDESDSDGSPATGEALIFSISKSFDL